MGGGIEVRIGGSPSDDSLSVAYFALAKYSPFDTEIKPKDVKVAKDLLERVINERLTGANILQRAYARRFDPDIKKLNEALKIVKDPKNWKGKPYQASKIVKEYLASQGVDYGHLLDLKTEARGRRGHGAECWC